MNMSVNFAKGTIHDNTLHKGRCSAITLKSIRGYHIPVDSRSKRDHYGSLSM
jgi:hypothetical protein